MATKWQQLKWDVFCFRKRLLLSYGFKCGLVRPYDDELIEKLRNVYYGGIPASIILLCDGLSNGFCYDRALLMARAFLEDEDDVQLIYASVDYLKLRPKLMSNDPLYADHCVCERITKDGNHYIYDTTMGLVFDKRFYWLMENPKVRKINGKELIKWYVENDEDRRSEDLSRDKYAAPLTIPLIEMSIGRPNEIYSTCGLLQREIELYKKVIDYNAVVSEIKEDMERKGFRC